MKMTKKLRNDTLSPVQTKVLAELLQGKTITDAATAAGVERVTVHRWLREDFAFQAAWNHDRRELRQETYAHLERLATKAANCLEKAIDGGDAKTAMEIVKCMGILAPCEIGSEDASELKSQADAERLSTEAEVTERDGELKRRVMFARLANS